jgi:hypothetical protein
MGGDLTYNRISANKIELNIVLYRDCSGTLFSNELTFRIYDNDSVKKYLNGLPNLLPNTSYTEYKFKNTQRSALKSNLPDCNLSQLYCAEKWVYKDTIELKNNQSGYHVVWYGYGRNFSISNIKLDLQTSIPTCTKTPFGFISHIFIPPLNIVNSSPQFLSEPVPLICRGSKLNFNHNAFDPDGDSLVFSIVKPYSPPPSCSSSDYLTPHPPGHKNFQEVVFSNGYTLDYPFGTNADPIEIDSISGEITANPTTVGNYVIAVAIKEYRVDPITKNVTYLGETRRDLQFIVTNCNTGGAILNTLDSLGYERFVEVGDSLKIEINGVNPARDSIYLTAVGSMLENDIYEIKKPLASLSPTSGYRRMTGNFIWAPTCDHITYTSPHLVTFTLSTPACFTHTKTYKIYVRPKNIIPPPKFVCVNMISNDVIRIDFDTVNTKDFLYYILYRKKQEDSVWNIIDTIKDLNSLSYIDSFAFDNLNNRYQYRFRGTNTCNFNGSYSNSFSNLVLSAEKIDTNKYILKWNNFYELNDSSFYSLYYFDTLSNSWNILIDKIKDTILNLSICNFNKYVKILYTSDSNQCSVASNEIKLISEDNNIHSSIIGKDTLCNGEFSMYSSSLLSNYYFWKMNDKLISDSSSVLEISSDSNFVLKLINYNNPACFYESSKEIIVTKPLKLIIPDTLMACKNGIFKIKAKYSGGLEKKYKFSWNYDIFDTISTFSSVFLEDRLITCILTDECGSKNDTQYTFVTLKQNIKLRTSTIDTLICFGDNITIFAKASGGDSANHTITWLNNGSIADSFVYQGFADTVLTAVLSDNCTQLNDTVSVRIRIGKPLSINIPASDTLLCYGSNHVFKLSADGGLPQNYQYTVNGVGLDSDTFSINALRDTLLWITISDGCSEPDSALMNISIRNPLTLRYNLPDTTVCYGTSITVKLSGSGGLSQNYVYQFINKSDTDSFFSFTAQQDTVIKAILTDGCSLPSDTYSLSIKVLEPLKLIGNPDTTVCFGSEVTLKVKPTGGQTTNHIIRWNVTQTGDSYTFTANRDTTIKAILSDGCSQPNDSIVFNINVLDPLNVQLFADTPVCPDRRVVVKALANGGNGNYKYAFINRKFELSDSFVYQSKNDTIIQCIVSDDCSLNDTTTLQIRTIPPPIASLSFTQTEFCAPVILTFDNTTESRETSKLRWNLGDGRIIETPDQSSLTAVYETPGRYRVGLWAENTAGCTDSYASAIEVVVNPRPTANFTTNRDSFLLNGEELRAFNQSSSDSRNFLWLSGDGRESTTRDFRLTYTDTGLYNLTLVAYNQYNCEDSNIRAIKILDAPIIFIPNAFTPNDDTRNESFQPSFVGVRDYSMKIFNRWGQLVYEGKSWIPQTNQQDGVYLYVISYTDYFNTPKQTTGIVNLLR